MKIDNETYTLEVDWDSYIPYCVRFSAGLYEIVRDALGKEWGSAVDPIFEEALLAFAWYFDGLNSERREFVFPAINFLRTEDGTGQKHTMLTTTTGNTALGDVVGSVAHILHVDHAFRDCGVSMEESKLNDLIKKIPI